MEADALTPMADLAARWGVTPNTVSRRLAFLGIKPIRQGNFRFLTSEQLDLAEQLQQHVLSGQPMEAFPRPNLEEGGQVMRRVAGASQVPAQVMQVEEMAALAVALGQQLKPADPLQRARGLAEASDNALVLTSADLADLLGQGVSGWKDGHEAYGYRFRRHQQGRQVLWVVERAVAVAGKLAAVSGRAKRVGFATPEVIEARVEVLSTGTALFASNLIG